MMFLGMCAATAAVLGLYLIRTDSGVVQVQAQVLPSPSPSVAPSPVPTPSPTGQGCTPGFWKNNATKKGASQWPVSTTTALGSIFSLGDVPGSPTLLDALSFQGGDTLEGAEEILLRAAAAAYLNELTFGGDTAALIAAVDAAIASGDRTTIINLANALDAANNAGCPLSNS